MARIFAEDEKGKMFRTTESCSVCLESVSNTGERSIAMLKCGHHFHLDCIGSAFNVKGAMQCPNCRHVEDGQWLYANGSRWTDDFAIDSTEEEYEDFSPMRSMMELDAFGHWVCPFTANNMPIEGNGSPHVLLSFGDVDRPNAFSQGLMLRIESFSNSEVPICPYLAAQREENPRLPSAAPNGPSMLHQQHSNSVGTSSNSVGSSMSGGGGSGGGGVGGMGIRPGGGNDLWGVHHNSPLNGNSIYTYGGVTADTTSGLADRSNIRHTADLDLSLMPPHSGGSNVAGMFAADVGSTGNWHERPRPWTRSENDRPGMFSGHGSSRFREANPDHSGYDCPYIDGSSSTGGLCPRPHVPYTNGQVGMSQVPQPHASSAFRNPPAIASRRMSRLTTSSAASLMSNARNHAHMQPAASDRRHFQAWNEFPQAQESSTSSSLFGAAANSHGSSYHHGSNISQGFVPWRRESSSSTLPLPVGHAGMFNSPDQVWQPNSRFSDSQALYHSRHADEHREYNLFPSRGMYADYPTGSPPPYLGIGDAANEVAGGALSHGIQARMQR